MKEEMQMANKPKIFIPTNNNKKITFLSIKLANVSNVFMILVAKKTDNLCTVHRRVSG